LRQGGRKYQTDEEQREGWRGRRQAKNRSKSKGDRMVGKGTHIKDVSEVKRPRVASDDTGQQQQQQQADEAGHGAHGTARKRIEHGQVNSGGARFVVGVGADDVDPERLGEGTRRLQGLLWSLRDVEFERMALANEKHP
jgi:hypothetical protein